MNKRLSYISAFLIPLAVLVILLIVLPSILGGSSTFSETQYKVLDTNLEVSESGDYEVKLDKSNVQFFAISGSANGGAEVYLYEASGGKLKVYSNLNGKFNTITGFATAKNSFQNECVDTCYMGESKFNSQTYKLHVEVSPGTTLKITKIVYS